MWDAHSALALACLPPTVIHSFMYSHVWHSWFTSAISLPESDIIALLCCMLHCLHARTVRVSSWSGWSGISILWLDETANVISWTSTVYCDLCLSSGSMLKCAGRSPGIHSACCWDVSQLRNKHLEEWLLAKKQTPSGVILHSQCQWSGKHTERGALQAKAYREGSTADKSIQRGEHCRQKHTERGALQTKAYREGSTAGKSIQRGEHCRLRHTERGALQAKAYREGSTAG